MKRMVVTNKAGDIIATAPDFEASGYPKSKGGAPTFQIIIPLRGQYVHRVEFPDDALSVESLLRFHQTHRVRATKGGAMLEARGKTSAQRAPTRKGKASTRVRKPR
jgi:hypothetical protein